MESHFSIARNIERRILARFMDLQILSVLNHDSNEISGYELIKYFHRRFSFLMSSGTVYSQLHFMEREGLLRSKPNGGKRVYVLTEDGKEKAKVILNSKDRIMNFMCSLFT